MTTGEIQLVQLQMYQQAHDTIITSSWPQKHVATSFWRRNGVFLCAVCPLGKLYRRHISVIVYQITGLTVCSNEKTVPTSCVGNPPVTRGLPTQGGSNEDSISMSWCPHVCVVCPEEPSINRAYPYREQVIYCYNDVIMGVMTSQITSLTIVYSAVYSGVDPRKHRSSASLAFVRPRWIPRTKGQ